MPNKHGPNIKAIRAMTPLKTLQTCHSERSEESLFVDFKVFIISTFD